jgi:hypothetical protein
MDSPRSGELRFFDVRDERPLDAPGEWAPAWLVVDHPPTEWEQVRVTVDGCPLDVALRRARSGERWISAMWPRSGAGKHRVLVERGPQRSEVLVSIQPTKIGEAAVEQLFFELESKLPTEVALALQRLGALAGVTLHHPDDRTLAGERSRLRRAVNGTAARRGVAALIAAIERRPHQALARDQRWVNAAAARRPSVASPYALASRAQNVAARAIVEVIDQRTTVTLDTIENRLVATFFGEVRARVARFAEACAAQRQSDAYREAMEWRRTLDLARRGAPWMDEVGALQSGVPAPSMAMLRRDEYREAYEGWLAFHRSQSVRLQSEAMLEPIENIPALYQLWATLRLMVALAKHAVDAGFRVVDQRLVRTLRGTHFVQVLPDGQPALVLRDDADRLLRVIPECTYSSGKLSSVSYPQRPDLAIELSDTQRTRVWIFDPKYKLVSEGSDPSATGRPVKSDVDKMHAYRDAIVDQQHRRVVEFAATLYPGATEHFGAAVAAIRAVPGESWEEAIMPTLVEALSRRSSAPTP